MQETRAPAGGDPSSENNKAAPASAKAIVFILITVVIDVTGLGIIIPVLPRLIGEVSGGSMADAAVIGGWLMFAYAFMQFLSAPLLGNLSDRLGRRPVLLVGLACLGIDYTIMALAQTLGWLFAGRILAGMAAATFVTAFAYVADVSAPEKRAANFGLVGMSFGVGFVIGPALGGLLGALDTRAPFVVASLLCFANVAFGLFVLPESLRPESRRRFDWRRANPVGSVLRYWKVKPILMLIAAFALLELALHVYPAIWAYFTPAVYGWSTTEVGLSLALFGILLAFAEGVVLRFALARFGEHKVVIGSTALAIVTFLLFAFVTSGAWAYGVMVLASLSGLGSNAMKGLAANAVDESEQGEVQGAIMSAKAAVFFVAPPILTGLFSAFSGGVAWLPVFPGAPFLLAALIGALVFVPYFAARRRGIRDSAGADGMLR
ncbi:TCR/Tet family MFS transporter [Rhodobium gokarnense]|uniref:DHA1 family tetracycline resistance protein-like MFS transporter n=1 Tax=Rhodobium gokarnense TaxID=364296 RepID=A0ABT3H6A8_9HYPH|nr:TCR/Tet family MFS transporter [Rhodobium gokarnense]MCW2305927.1 DHA1 family tetracycline resistance protein-like MFS transporter [Rhodobium gokarnense]